MKARLLIIDDDDLVRASLALEASENGYWAATANSGEAALELAQRQTFDLIICDIRMPGMGGLETIERLREPLPLARVIVITGYASPDTPIKALRLRVDDYLMKPFDGPTFLKSVARVLQPVERASGIRGHASADQDSVLALLRNVLGDPNGRLLRAQSVATRASELGFSPRRIRQLYLAALLLDLEPALVACVPGLYWQSMVIAQAHRVLLERRNGRERLLDSLIEARLIADVVSSLEDRECEPLLDSSLFLPQDSSIGVENTLRLALKHRAQGQLEREAALYQELLTAELHPEFLVQVKFQQLTQALEMEDSDRVRLLGSELRELTRVHNLPLWSARVTLEMAKLVAVGIDEVYSAREVFSTWDDDEHEACCNLLLAALGDSKAQELWRASPYSELAGDQFPKQASRGGHKVDDLGQRSLGQARIQGRLLGPFRLEFGDRVLADKEWASKRDRLLVAYLCTRLGSVSTEDELLELLWQKDGVKARHSLHNSVSQARRVLSRFTGLSGKELIVRAQDGYRVGPSVETDLVAFEMDLNSGREAAFAGDWEKALFLLHRADRSVLGDVMEGDYQEWTFALRERVRSLQLECLTLLADYFGKRRRHRKSLLLWSRILELDDCHEEAYLGSLRALRALKKKAEAVRLYRRAEETFRRELGLEAPTIFREILSEF